MAAGTYLPHISLISLISPFAASWQQANPLTPNPRTPHPSRLAPTRTRTRTPIPHPHPYTATLHPYPLPPIYAQHWIAKELPKPEPPPIIPLTAPQVPPPLEP